MVAVSEEHPIDGAKVSHLVEAVRSAFDSPMRVERMVYERARPTLTIERLVPEDALGKDAAPAFLTPYQMVRQHADIEVLEPGDWSPVEAVARAVQSLTSRGYRLTMFVVENREVVREWFGRDLRVEDIWQVPLREDPETREDGLFVVGSKVGALIHEIEAAVLCRIEVVS